MSWEEIENESQDDQRVGTQAVRFVTKDRKFDGRALYYYSKFYVGGGLAKQLGWTEATTLKFIWGSGPQKGYLRIVPIINKAAGGFKLRVLKTKSIAIVNKMLPANTHCVDRDVGELEYAIGDTTGGTTVKFLEVTLPDDFYKPDTEVVAKTGTKQRALVDAPVHIETPRSEVRMVSPGFTSPVLPATPKLPSAQPKTILPPGTVLVDPRRADDTWVDIAGVCGYITKYMGELARVIDARTVRITDKQCDHATALTMANRHREQQNRPPFQLRTQV